jgi:hypothetical protein
METDRQSRTVFELLERDLGLPIINADHAFRPIPSPGSDVGDDGADGADGVVFCCLFRPFVP